MKIAVIVYISVQKVGSHDFLQRFKWLDSKLLQMLNTFKIFGYL